MGTAVDMELLGRSPCRGIKLPAPKSEEKRVLTPDELHALADAIGEQWRAMVYLSGVMGLRFGEVAALQVADVDFERGRLSITKAVSEGGSQLRIGPPKTVASSRSLDLPKPMLDEIPDMSSSWCSTIPATCSSPTGPAVRSAPATSGTASSSQRSARPVSTVSPSTASGTRPPPSGWPPAPTPAPCNAYLVTLIQVWCFGSTLTRRMMQSGEL